MRRNGGVSREVAREREARAWELSKQGLTESAIAKELGVTQQAVSAILIKLQKRAIKSLDTLIIGEKVRQYEQLRYIAEEAMLAWERSKGPARSVTKHRQEKQARGPDGARDGLDKEGNWVKEFPLEVTDVVTDTTRKIEERDGDPRYLTTALTSLGDIRRLLGLNAPIEVDHDWTKLLPAGMNPDDLLNSLADAIVDGEVRLLEDGAGDSGDNETPD